MSIPSPRGVSGSMEGEQRRKKEPRLGKGEARRLCQADVTLVPLCVAYSAPLVTFALASVLPGASSHDLHPANVHDDIFLRCEDYARMASLEGVQ